MNRLRQRSDPAVRRAVGSHFDPDGGTPYWLERERAFDLAREQLIATVTHTESRERADSLRLRVCALWARQGESMRARVCYQETRFTGGDELRALALHRIAALSGLPDTRRLRLTFTRLVGLSPAAYRQGRAKETT